MLSHLKTSMSSLLCHSWCGTLPCPPFDSQDKDKIEDIWVPLFMTSTLILKPICFPSYASPHDLLDTILHCIDKSAPFRCGKKPTVTGNKFFLCLFFLSLIAPRLVLRTPAIIILKTTVFLNSSCLTFDVNIHPSTWNFLHHRSS